MGGRGGGGLGISYIPLIFGQNIPYPVNFGGLYLQLLCSISLNFLLKYPVFLKFFTQISRIPNGVFNVIFSADICTIICAENQGFFSEHESAVLTKMVQRCKRHCLIMNQSIVFLFWCITLTSQSDVALFWRLRREDRKTTKMK